jgi:hypothetical protein
LGLYGWFLAKKLWNEDRSIENVKDIVINKKPRSKIKPSDHTPIELEIN